MIDERDIEAVTAALRSEWLTTGPRVPEFEAGLVEATGARHAVAFSSGTAALHGAAAVAGLGPGDEAITTPMTFVASANAVLYTGATPRFADVDPDSLLIDPGAVAAAVTRTDAGDHRRSTTPASRPTTARCGRSPTPRRAGR